MAGYVKAEQRREQARAAALRVLDRGQVGFNSLALRHVAQEMDVPLSTLTYAYPSTRLLLEDLSEQYDQDLWDTLMANVQGEGLQRELHRVADWFLTEFLRKPSSHALLLWRLQSLARGERPQAAAATSTRSTELMRTIAGRSGEHYRVPHEVLGNVLAAIAMGETVRWVAADDERTYWSTVRAGLDGLTLLADPRPLDQPHPEPPPLDYLKAPIPHP